MSLYPVHLDLIIDNNCGTILNTMCSKGIVMDELRQFQNIKGQPLPLLNLPVLDALIAVADKEQSHEILSKTAIYYVHHPLQTSRNVVDAMFKLGAKSENIYVLGKRYSECDDVVEALIHVGVHYQRCSMQKGLGQYSSSFIQDINWLWFKVMQTLNQNIENILVLDHGGHAATYIPSHLLEHYRVVGVEKTSAGLFDIEKKGSLPYPIIDVANSITKRQLESPLIAKAVVKKIISQLPKPDSHFRYGVVGLGSIGTALVEQLHALGYSLIVYDEDSHKLERYKTISNTNCANSLSALISASDWIFGCSGRDITETTLEQFRLATHNKTLVSCSSEDKEFLSLLRKTCLQKPLVFDPLDTIEYRSEFGAEIKILRGGFPVNFDHSGESVEAKDIQLTRALVVSAIMQAVGFLDPTKEVTLAGIYHLDEDLQQFITNEWLKACDQKSMRILN